MKRTVCCISNGAPHYRASIYHHMDKELGCDFVFGDDIGNIQQMDITTFEGNAVFVKNNRLMGFVWQSNVIKRLFQDYNTFIFSGDIHYLSTWLFCLMNLILRKKKKIFFWTHGLYGKEGKIVAFFKKQFYSLANAGLFLYGNYAKNLLINEGFDKNKLFVLHNSLNYEKQIELRKGITPQKIYYDHFKNENPNLVFIGRLAKVKQLNYVIEALHKCKEDGHNFNMTFIGDGKEKESLVSLTEKLGLKDKVWFYGACYDEATIAQLIFEADLCVSPGNVGLTAMHALVYGTPVITHDNFKLQMPEFEAIKEGETGAFYKYLDIDSFAKTIESWLFLKKDQRDTVRQACMEEIDENWQPHLQITILNQSIFGDARK